MLKTEYVKDIKSVKICLKKVSDARDTLTRFEGG